MYDDPRAFLQYLGNYRGVRRIIIDNDDDDVCVCVCVCVRLYVYVFTHAYLFGYRTILIVIIIYVCMHVPRHAMEFIRFLSFSTD